MICPPTRVAALKQLEEFIAIAPRYGWDRNDVRVGHPSVSRLSPAIRHRLITEDEVAAAVLSVHPLEKVMKFVQEIYWRRYWKSWLSLRPSVWTDFRASLAKIYQEQGRGAYDKACRGELGNSVIDYFASELVQTGYLHNHARMWFAAWWIHEARLPWEMGAAFFHSHLLDGDPASNTLSWRWVAGLQTLGKTYLARRSNLGKYLSRDLKESLADGLAAFEHPKAFVLPLANPAPVTRPNLPTTSAAHPASSGLWIHEEDLSPENSLLGEFSFSAVTVTGHSVGWNEEGFPEAKREWLEAALSDGASRAARHWKAEVALTYPEHLADHLAAWAGNKDIKRIVTPRPDIGLLNDEMPELIMALENKGIELVMVDRQRDLELRPLATGGFFRFWEVMQKNTLLPK